MWMAQNGQRRKNWPVPAPGIRFIQWIIRRARSVLETGFTAQSPEMGSRSQQITAWTETVLFRSPKRCAVQWIRSILIIVKMAFQRRKSIFIPATRQRTL